MPWSTKVWFVNNPLTPNLCLVFIVHAALLTGCGDPLFASFVVEQADNRNPDADAGSKTSGASDKLPQRDGAIARNRDASAPKTTQGVDSDGCYTLPDLTAIAPADAGSLSATLAASLGCALVDGGTAIAGPGTVFERRDGKPMLARGEQYSFRWVQDTWVSRVQLVGGAEQCSTDIIVNEVGTGTSTDLLIAGGLISTCRTFRSPIDAQFVRLPAHLDQVFSLEAGLTFKLCPSVCPPNTESPLSDGGV